MDALDAVKSVSVDFEFVQPETSEYFIGLFRRAGRAWSLGYAVAKGAGMEEQYTWPGEERALAAFHVRAALPTSRRLGSWLGRCGSWIRKRTR